MPGSANYVSASRALWSATKPNTIALTGAVLIGQLAPGTSLGDPTTNTADGFGFKAGVGASQDLTIMVYGTAALPALVTAKDASPPGKGYLIIVNKSGTRADIFNVSVQEAAAFPVVDDDARARVRYMFNADNDTIEDFHTVVSGSLTLPTE